MPGAHLSHQPVASIGKDHSSFARNAGTSAAEVQEGGKPVGKAKSVSHDKKGSGTSAAEVQEGKPVSTRSSKSAIAKAKTVSHVHKNAVKKGVGISAAELPEGRKPVSTRVSKSAIGKGKAGDSDGEVLKQKRLAASGLEEGEEEGEEEEEDDEEDDEEG